MTGDQQWPVYDPGSEPPRTLGERTTEEPTVARRRSPLLAVVVAACVLAGAGAAGFALLDDDPSAPPAAAVDREPEVAPVDEPPVQPAPVEPVEQPEPAPVDVLTAEGYRALLAALEERTGSTEVFSVSLHDSFASLEIPVDARTQREVRLFWDGEFDGPGMKSTAVWNARIDLADIDPAVFIRLVRQARRGVEDPTSSYVIIDGPPTSGSDDGTRIKAYASNEYGEGGYLGATADGTITRNHLD